jgi:hypothetical protein
MAIGCADDQKKPATQPTDPVLKDPFGWKPFDDEPSVSGGGLGHYDKKAMNHDVKTLVDP